MKKADTLQLHTHVIKSLITVVMILPIRTASSPRWTGKSSLRKRSMNLPDITGRGQAQVARSQTYWRKLKKHGEMGRERGKMSSKS